MSKLLSFAVIVIVLAQSACAQSQESSPEPVQNLPPVELAWPKSDATYEPIPMPNPEYEPCNGSYLRVYGSHFWHSGTDSLAVHAGFPLLVPEEVGARGVTWGRVRVGFTVEPSGRVRDAFALDEIGGGVDEAIVRAVREAPFDYRVCPGDPVTYESEIIASIRFAFPDSAQRDP